MGASGKRVYYQDNRWIMIVNIQYDSKETVNLRKLEKFLIKHSLSYSIQKLEQQIKKKCEEPNCPKFFAVVASNGRRKYCEDHENKYGKYHKQREKLRQISV